MAALSEGEVEAVVREITEEEVVFYREHGWVMLKQLVHPAFATEMLAAGLAHSEAIDGQTELMTRDVQLEPYHSFMFSERMEKNATRCAPGVSCAHACRAPRNAPWRLYKSKKSAGRRRLAASWTGSTGRASWPVSPRPAWPASACPSPLSWPPAARLQGSSPHRVSPVQMSASILCPAINTVIHCVIFRALIQRCSAPE